MRIGQKLPSGYRKKLSTKNRIHYPQTVVFCPPHFPVFPFFCLHLQATGKFREKTREIVFHGQKLYLTYEIFALGLRFPGYGKEYLQK